MSLWGVLSIAEWVLVGPGVTDGRVSCFGPCVGALQKPDHSLDRSTGLRGGGSQKRPFNPTGYPSIKVLKGRVYCQCLLWRLCWDRDLMGNRQWVMDRTLHCPPNHPNCMKNKNPNSAAPRTQNTWMSLKSREVGQQNNVAGARWGEKQKINKTKFLCVVWGDRA